MWNVLYRANPKTEEISTATLARHCYCSAVNTSKQEIPRPGKILRSCIHKLIVKIYFAVNFKFDVSYKSKWNGKREDIFHKWFLEHEQLYMPTFRHIGNHWQDSGSWATSHSSDLYIRYFLNTAANESKAKSHDIYYQLACRFKRWERSKEPQQLLSSLASRFKTR